MQLGWTEARASTRDEARRDETVKGEEVNKKLRAPRHIFSFLSSLFDLRCVCVSVVYLCTFCTSLSPPPLDRRELHIASTHCTFFLATLADPTLSETPPFKTATLQPPRRSENHTTEAMASLIRPSFLQTASRLATSTTTRRAAPALLQTRGNAHDHLNPPRGNPPVADRSPPDPPREEAVNIKDNLKSGSFLGTTRRLPEFNLNDKVILVTGAARGLGLVQAEALLEAGATVYALDRLPEPSEDFLRVQTRAAEELGKKDHFSMPFFSSQRKGEIWRSIGLMIYLGNTLHYRQIDVRDVPNLNDVVKSISETQGRLDGLIAAAGIQQETPALDYTAKDANTMFEVRQRTAFGDIWIAKC